MKVYRFMSRDEFDRYLKGENLINTTEHRAKTSSIGFCFFDLEEYEPEIMMHSVSGIVSFDVCAVFEVDEKLLNKSWGVYAKPLESTGIAIFDMLSLLEAFGNKFEANEYCTTHYDNKFFKLVKHTTNLWDQWDRLYNKQKLNWIGENDET